MSTSENRPFVTRKVTKPAARQKPNSGPLKAALTLLFVLLARQFAFGQWSTNSGVNNPICTQFDVQNTIQMISDGSGGAIITWIDYRLPGYTIFAQRISGGGSNQWTTNGVQISPASINGQAPSITSDDHGGAIISWSGGGDFGSIYAQRINSAGALQWPSNGVLVCAATATQQAGGAKITGDGSGGAILAWNDSRNNVDVNDDDVYAQRINSNGVIQWAANGVAVVAQTGYQGSLQMTSDGNGGAVIVWEDNRSVTDIDVYAQKVDATGAMQWLANGVALTSAIGGNEQYLQMVGDAGGQSSAGKAGGMERILIFIPRRSIPAAWLNGLLTEWLPVSPPTTNNSLS